MSKQNVGRRILGGMAAATLGALLLAPPSGWLVKTQVKMASGVGFASGFEPTQQAEQAAKIAARNPNDLALQMAAQDWGTARPVPLSGDESPKVQELRLLLPRYGNEPFLHATFLRYLSQNAVNLDNRHEQDLVSPPPPTVKPTETVANVNLPENLALWEASAQAGEKLDGNNAYFPLMHAVGLFAARRDDEAINALLRAGTKPRYNEYLAEETEGRWRLIEQAHGEPGYVARLGVQAGQLFPQYARIRALARLATAKAIEAETAGDKERGFQIRMAVLRVGAQMRTGSSTFIGTLVGGAVGTISWARPGGAAPLPPAVTKEQRDKRTEEKLDRYTAYLKSIGHDNAASEVRWEYGAFQKARKMWNEAEEKPENIIQLRPAVQLVVLWASGVALLSNALFVLLSGTVGTLLTRTRRIQNNLPLHPAVRNGLFSTALLPVCAFGLATEPEWTPAALIFAGTVALGIRFIVAVRRHQTRAQAVAPAQTAAPSAKGLRAVLVGNVGIYCATLGAGAALLGGLLLLSSGGTLEVWNAGASLLGTGATESDPIASPLLRTLLGGAISSVVSALLWVGFAVWGRIKRVPVSVGVARGFRRFALPVASVLVLLYAGVALETLREEAKATRDLKQCVASGEGQYVSDLLNKPWPGRYVSNADAEGNQAK